MAEIDLKDIVSNSDNSREPTPVLQGLGYGVVEPVEGGDKPSLFTLALGNAAEKAQYCKLVEQHEEGLVDLAKSINQHGLLQDCRVRQTGENKYALTFGARRCLAVLYLHAQYDRPAKVNATIGEEVERAALVVSAAENIHLPPSYIDQARLFERLRGHGLSVKQIAKVYPMGRATEQNIRHRLRLLQLPTQVQQKVHHGQLSQDAALQLLEKAKNGKRQAPPEVQMEEAEESKPATEDEPQQPPQKGEASAGQESKLRAILSGLIDGLLNFDFDSFSPQKNLDELGHVLDRAQRLLRCVKRKLSIFMSQD